MKIAITAASGSLGISIIRKAISEFGRNRIIGIARSPEKIAHLGIEVRKGDYNNKNDFISAFEGVDQVLIISGLDSPEQRVKQHKNIIEAAINNNVIKIVYTSIAGSEGGSAFDKIIRCNRQTEKDIINSGLEWSIGRNGLYIEPDLEYLENYIKTKSISNCAGMGKCAYTSRSELANAYIKLLKNEDKNGNIFNLTGESITQQQLAEMINEVFDVDLRFINMGVDEYRKNRGEELGEFLGDIISGIYENILNGAFDSKSDFIKVTGRPHQSHLDFIKSWKIHNDLKI